MSMFTEIENSILTNILIQIFSPLWQTLVSNWNFRLMKLIVILFFKILKNSFPTRIEYYLNQPVKEWNDTERTTKRMDY